MCVIQKNKWMNIENEKSLVYIFDIEIKYYRFQLFDKKILNSHINNRKKTMEWNSRIKYIYTFFIIEKKTIV